MGKKWRTDTSFNISISSGVNFDRACRICKDVLKNKLESMTQARTDKPVYRVECDKKLYRFDFGFKYLDNTDEQKIASEIVNIPKIIFTNPNNKYKISEWFDGVDLSKVWANPEVFIKSGELMGELNLIKNEATGLYLSNSEFSSSNAIWTPDEKVYLIDLGKLRWAKNVDVSIMQVLLKRIRMILILVLKV